MKIRNLLLLLCLIPGRTLFAQTPAEGADTNVNSQYIVESVEVRGLLRSQYSDALYDDMQKMVGQMLDNAKVEELRKRLGQEPALLKSKPFISQKI